MSKGDYSGLQDNLKNEAGFSLVGVMVSSAIAAIVVASIASMTNYSAKSQRTLANQSEQNSLKNEIIQTFNDIKACQNALSGVSLRNLRSPVVLKNPGNPSGSPLAAAGVKKNGITVQSMYFSAASPIDVSDPNKQKYLATLTYVIDRGTQGYSARQVTESVDVYVVTNAARTITECYGSLSSAQVCSEFGGVYNTTANPKCQIPPAKACSDIGGVYNAAANPKCQLSTPAQACADLGGVYNAAANPKCQLSTPAQACANLGGVYNAAANPKCQLSTPAQACADLGGVYNAAANPKCQLASPAQICTSIGGVYSAFGNPKCQLPPPKVPKVDYVRGPAVTIVCDSAAHTGGQVACPAGTVVVSCARFNPSYPAHNIFSKGGGWERGTLGEQWSIELVQPGGALGATGGCQFSVSCLPDHPYKGATMNMVAGCFRPQ